MRLFAEELGVVRTDNELVTLQKQYSSYDPSYVCQSTVLIRRKIKEWIEQLWQQYEPYSDTHFSNEFKLQFVQRSWELYLGTTLLNRGFELGKHRDCGPDFDVINPKDNKRVAWVEAIAVTKGNGPDRVPEITYGGVMSIPEEEMLLRIATALDKKHKKYISDLKNGFVKEDEPYVIAIDRSDLEHVDTGIPLILKALFGIGHLTLRVPLGARLSEESETSWSRRSIIEKKSGEDVPMQFFENTEHSGISAVIYSVRGILNSPQLSNEMGEDFVIVHNPLASVPLPLNTFPFGDEYGVDGENIKKLRARKIYIEPDAFDFLSS